MLLSGSLDIICLDNKSISSSPHKASKSDAQHALRACVRACVRSPLATGHLGSGIPGCFPQAPTPSFCPGLYPRAGFRGGGAGHPSSDGNQQPGKKGHLSTVLFPEAQSCVLGGQKLMCKAMCGAPVPTASCQGAAPRPARGSVLAVPPGRGGEDAPSQKTSLLWHLNQKGGSK